MLPPKLTHGLTSVFFYGMTRDRMDALPVQRPSVHRRVRPTPPAFGCASLIMESFLQSLENRRALPEIFGNPVAAYLRLLGKGVNARDFYNHL